MNSSKKQKKNAEKPKNITVLGSEESENYFSTSEDGDNDVETTLKKLFKKLQRKFGIEFCR